jgi:hypothetical protein
MLDPAIAVTCRNAASLSSMSRSTSSYFRYLGGDTKNIGITDLEAVRRHSRGFRLYQGRFDGNTSTAAEKCCVVGLLRRHILRARLAKQRAMGQYLQCSQGRQPALV